MVELTEERAATGDLDEPLREFLAAYPPDKTDRITFLRAQFDAGLAYVWFPRGFGGLEQPIGLQAHVDEVLRAAGAPP